MSRAPRPIALGLPNLDGQVMHRVAQCQLVLMGGARGIGDKVPCGNVLRGSSIDCPATMFAERRQVTSRNIAPGQQGSASRLHHGHVHPVIMNFGRSDRKSVV